MAYAVALVIMILWCIGFSKGVMPTTYGAVSKDEHPLRFWIAAWSYLALAGVVVVFGLFGMF